MQVRLNAILHDGSEILQPILETLHGVIVGSAFVAGLAARFRRT